MVHQTCQRNRYRVDSSAPPMHHDMSDLGSWILIRNISVVIYSHWVSICTRLNKRALSWVLPCTSYRRQIKLGSLFEILPLCLGKIAQKLIAICSPFKFLFPLFRLRSSRCTSAVCMYECISLYCTMPEPNWNTFQYKYYLLSQKNPYARLQF